MKPYQVSGQNVAKPRDSDALQWSVELQQECSIHIALGHGYPGFESFFGSSIGCLRGRQRNQGIHTTKGILGNSKVAHPTQYPLNELNRLSRLFPL